MSSLWLLLGLSTTLAVLLAAPAESLRAGASSRSVLPTINGSQSYWTTLPDEDATSPGTFVPPGTFDQGRVAIGNGGMESIYVRDDVRVNAIALDDEAGSIVIIISAEVYMIFEPDMSCAGCFEDRVRAALPNLASSLRFLVHAQHNHHGPDTSGLGGPVNRDWYINVFTKNMVDAAVEAVNRLAPASLQYGSAPFRFGLEDKRDPRIFDFLAKIVKVVHATTGDLIATIVNWSMHPECTLGFSPTVPPADCEVLLSMNRDCDAGGKVHTGDFPAQFVTVLKRLNGGVGEVIYINGAIGALMQPFGLVWEVTADHPIGDGWNPPAGATMVQRTYRRAFLIGSELAKAVYNATLPFTLDDVPAFDVQEFQTFGRLTSLLFSAAMIPQSMIPGGDPTIPLVLGFALRPLYVCEAGVVPSLDNCVDDGFAWHQPFPAPGVLPSRVGEFAVLKSIAVRIGDVMTLLSIPGELAPELAYGLPADFDDSVAGLKYYPYPDEHVLGTEYTFPGVLETMLNCSDEHMCLFAGLGGEEMGYMFPLSDWRIMCAELDLALCAPAHAAGAMRYPVEMAGEDCDYIMFDKDARYAEYAARYGQAIADVCVQTCTHGQLRYNSGQHYEEMMAASWQAVDVYFASVAGVLNVTATGRLMSGDRQNLHLPPHGTQWDSHLVGDIDLQPELTLDLVRERIAYWQQRLGAITAQ